MQDMNIEIPAIVYKPSASSKMKNEAITVARLKEIWRIFTRFQNCK